MLLLQKILHGTSLPSTERLIRLYPFSRNRFFVVAGCFCRSQHGSTSQTACVFGFFACAKSTHSTPELNDGVSRTDTIMATRYMYPLPTGTYGRVGRVRLLAFTTNGFTRPLTGRVEDWRTLLYRPCFQPPPRQTQHAIFPHYAFLLTSS